MQEYSEALRRKNLDTTSLLVQGRTIETIMLEVKKLKIDLIITGNNNHSLIYNMFLESVSNEIIKNSSFIGAFRVRFYSFI
ncbi:universal stress protein [Psychroserpens sp.]